MEDSPFASSESFFHKPEIATTTTLTSSPFPRYLVRRSNCLSPLNHLYCVVLTFPLHGQNSFNTWPEDSSVLCESPMSSVILSARTKTNGANKERERERKDITQPRVTLAYIQASDQLHRKALCYRNLHLILGLAICLTLHTLDLRRRRLLFPD